MARVAYDQALSMSADDLLAILASAVNPDGTAFTLPTSGGAIAGAQTPAADYANPSDALDVVSLGMVWNTVDSKWDQQIAAGVDGVAAIGGNVGSGVADAGYPVKVGGKYNTTPPTFADGQRGDLQLNAKGNLKVGLARDSDGTVLYTNSEGDGNTGGTSRLGVIAEIHNFNGATFDRIRTPIIFQTVTATAAGDTAVWTPTSGKKFRVMAFEVFVTANAARSVAGLTEILLRDATTSIGVGYSVYVPGAAGTTFVDDSASGWIMLGNGYLSTAANNVLNVNISTAFTAGEVRVVVCGTEE